jgi:2'-5' RNA ligase
MTQPDQAIRVIRAFVAIALDDEARQQITETQNAMQRLQADVKWVAPLNIHLTLVFLGDIFDNLTDSIRAAIDRITASKAVCSCAIQGLGYFGSPTSPKVIWAGLQGNIQPLLALQADLVAALKAIGLSPDTRRPFHPHLTLGRTRSSRQGRELADFIQSRAEAPFGRIDIRQILLIQSRLTPQGPTYTILHESPLSKHPFIP